MESAGTGPESYTSFREFQTATNPFIFVILSTHAYKA
jgi:hypothetical protein